MMDVNNNKSLIVRDTVKLTPHIIPVIVALDDFFQSHQLKAFVTSGFRDPVNQLNVIRSYLKRKNLDTVYPDAMVCNVNDMLPDGTFQWQMAWSNLLNVGVIINPPLRAMCLMNYVVKGVNKKGLFINQTPHARGTAFDVGGNSNGIMDEAAVLAEAKKQNLAGLRGFLLERENNCVHVDCVSQA